MANAMVALANITLGSSAATVTFSSIPATYRDLRIVFNGGSSASGVMIMQFNGDTTAGNYPYVSMYGNGTSAASGSGSNILGNTTNTLEAMNTCDILDYSATDKHKAWLNRTSVASGISRAWAGRWASTSAITSIVLSLDTGTYLTGSTFSLYGIVS